MTKIKKTIMKSVSKISARLIIAIAVAVSVNRVFSKFPSAGAFSTSPSHSYASTKPFLERSVGTEKYNRFQRQPTSTLFAKERLHALDTDREAKLASEKSTKTEEKNRNGDLQQVLAGLVLSVTIATTSIGGFPLPANAGFGPSSGATTTPPPNLKSIYGASKVAPANQPTSDFNIDLDGKKLKILIDSALNPNRLEEFSGQLDNLIDNLLDSIGFGDDENDEEAAKPNSIESRREAARLRNEQREEELLKARNLQLQVKRQKEALIKLEKQPYWFNYLAAFIGSVVSTLIMHPIDTIKTRMQVRKEGDDEDTPWQSQPPLEDLQQPVKPRNVAVFGMSATAAPATAAAEDTAIAGQASAKTGIGGFFDLYEGLTGNLLKEGPPSSVYLGVYETVKYALAPKVAPAYLLWVYLVAGAAGETVGSIIRAPAEAVKSLVQSRTKDNAFEAAKSIFGTPEGRANVIRAWSASIGRDVPFGAIQLAVFETIKAAILNNPNIEIDSSTLLSEAIIGAFAGGVGAFVTNPTDVITTRIITQDTSGGSSDGVNGTEGEGDAPLGVIEMGKKIYEEEGAGAFFTGWSARVGYWAPAISIFLTCYCSVRRAGIAYNWFP